MYWKRNNVVFGVKDTWSLDASLSPIIAAGLKKFKETVMSDDNCAGIPGSFLPEWEHTDEDFKIAQDEWYDRLDKMIYAFEAKEPELPDGVFSPVKDWFEKGSARVVDQEAYANHRKEEEEHYRRVDEGLALFGKHFRDLWW